MNALLKFIKDLGIFAFILAGLTLLGSGLKLLLHPSDLVAFFSIIRHYTMIFNFTWNVPLLLTFVASSLFIEIAYWGFLGYVFIRNHFKD